MNKVLLLLTLCLVGCDNANREDYINKCFRMSPDTYSYKVESVAKDYYNVIDATKSKYTLEELHQEVSCDVYIYNELWFEVKNDIEDLKNKVHVLESKAK